MRRTIIPFLLILILVGGCKKEPATKPTGSLKAIAVYNQAYNENYDADKVEDILANAKNAYVLLDPFGGGVVEHVAAIKASNNEIGAYISIGTTEDWRDDHDELKKYAVSKQWSQWGGEFFIETVPTEVLDIMKLRIDKIAAWGFDWVEFDNMDWVFDDKYRKDYDIKATAAEGIAYYQALCTYAHSVGLKCMAKNTTEEASDFDGALYESYDNEKDWWDHAGAQQFLDDGKLVIVNHYNERNPNAVYQEYIDLYNSDISFICESRSEKKYIHYNE